MLAPLHTRARILPCASATASLAQLLNGADNRAKDNVVCSARDGHFLDNVTLFWLTNTGVSAARLYWENKLAFFRPKGVKVPTAVSVFPDELYQTPRNWAERAYPNLIHYNKVAKGGHFAAWEQPKLFAEEVRAGFRSLRQAN